MQSLPQTLHPWFVWCVENFSAETTELFLKYSLDDKSLGLFAGKTWNEEDIDYLKMNAYG